MDWPCQDFNQGLTREQPTVHLPGTIIYLPVTVRNFPDIARHIPGTVDIPGYGHAPPGREFIDVTLVLKD